MHMLRRLAVVLVVSATVTLWAQTLASIKVTPASTHSERVRILPNGDLIATSVNAITLISEGYEVPANQSVRLSNLPAWAYTERYDITASAAPGTSRIRASGGTVSPAVQAIFRQVLAERFHLVMRIESRRMPIYKLVVAPGGAKLAPSHAAGCIFDTAPQGCHRFVIGFGHPLDARAAGMDDLAHYIENWTDRPIVNGTGLAGLFRMATTGWQPMRLPPPPPNGAANVDFTHLPTIDTVLGGLGLELRKEVAPVPVYTVQQIERP